MSDNMKIWNAVKTPPQSALKEIKGGRLKGMTDISPQWRMMVLTEQFGPVGIGWTYEITRQWTEPGPHEQTAAFTNILLYICVAGEWSRGIPGTGGSMLTVKESAGLHFSDEAFKMSTTDAISVAAKALGVGSDVYMGQLDSKYQRQSPSNSGASNTAPVASPARDKVNQRIVDALNTIYGDDNKAKCDAIEEMTTFTPAGKDEPVKGKRDYRLISDKQANIVVKELEKHVANKEDKDEVVCADCGQKLAGGVCTTKSCPSAVPSDDFPF